MDDGKNENKEKESNEKESDFYVRKRKFDKGMIFTIYYMICGIFFLILMIGIVTGW